MARLLALLAYLLCFSVPARAQTISGFETMTSNGIVTGACAQGSAFPDGCAGLVPGNQFGVIPQFTGYTNFVSSVQQSGQTWAIGQAAHTIPWNIAGVDYQVGPSLTRAAMLNPIDFHPLNCTTANQAGHDYLECNTAAPNVQGYDFHPLTGTDAGQCILLRIQNANSGATVKNNHFQEDVGCVGAGTFNEAFLISNSTSFLDFEHNEVDGNCGNSTVQAANPAVDVADNRTGGASAGQLTNQYNWYHNACNRPGDSTDGSEVHQFNVFQNWCRNCSGGGFHGEAWESQTTTGTCNTSSCALVNVAQYTMDFNTVILNAIPANGYTGPFFILGGRVGSSVTNVEVVGNTIIGNDFNATITGATYVSGTGVLTVTVPNVSTSTGLSVTISNVTGTGSFASANGTFTTVTGTGLNAIAVNIGAGLTLTVTGGNAQSISSSYGIMSTSAQQFGTIKVAMNYVDTTGALTGKCILQGAGSSFGWTGSTTGNVLTITGIQATGNLTFSGNPTNGQNIVLNGVTWTFVTSGASGNQTNIGASLTATLTQLSSDLSASGNTSINVAAYTSSSTQLFITYNTPDGRGNNYTLGIGTAASARSNATLTGGFPSPTSPGILVPGAVIAGGTLVPPPTQNYPKLSNPFTGTGFGLSGTYALDSSPPNSTSGVPTYTPQSVVGSWVIPTDAAPHLGGSENWNLLTNTPITGFTDANITSTPVC